MMRKPQGYACIMDPEEGTREADTFTCFHCQRITHVKAKASPEDLGGLCRVCNQLICSRCVGGKCDPFIEQVERMEAKERARRSYGL